MTNSKDIFSDLNKKELKLETDKDNDININNEIIININQKFTDSELNHMSYIEALKNDKRTYFQYYFSLLKTKNMLFFSFCPNNDYNSKISKIFLFFFSFALFYTINALFFNDSTMHKILEDNGNFNFVYQLNQIFYSSIISLIITEIIKYFSLTEKNILKIKNEKNINKLDNIAKDVLKCLKIKFILFFIISFLFLLIFWYYLGIFGAIYKNTQTHLIKDTLFSFGFSLLYSFIFNLVPGIFRNISLKDKNRDLFYIISKFIQIIF